MARFRNSNSAFKRKLARFLLVTTSLCVPGLVQAQVVAADKATQVYTARNGVTVVDIARANADGLSHNRFEQYSVPTNGVVLNNGNRDVLNRQSQLAGAVTANLNLEAQARVILNEVTGANRSILAGYTEVLGGKADVFVANPYGITCNGCGFINAPQVTLTTGRANIDGNGHLGGFSVTGGDILITGKGLNASAQDYLALVARSVKLDAQVNARTLDVVAGANDWNSDAMVVTARRATDTGPEFAIDSTALGGMYANRIRLIATEAGVGVRALGDVAASGSDFSLDAAGRVVLGSKLSAAGDVKIATTGAAITLQQASLTATRDISLGAGAGAIALSGGALVAGRDLALNAASLADDAAASAAGDQNRRSAAGALTVTTTGNARVGGLAYEGNTLSVNSGGDMTASDAVLLSRSSLTLASKGAMALGASSARAASGLTVTAGGLLSTTAGTNQGLIANAGTVMVSAGGIDNKGTISADGGDVALSSTAAIANAGTIHARQALNLGNAAARVDLRNEGKLLADGTATIAAASLTNIGAVQSAVSGSVTANRVTNSGTLALGTASGDAAITAANLTNVAAGTIQTAGALKVDGLATLDNAGVMLAGTAVSLNGNGTYLNQKSGTLQAGTTLDVTGARLDNAGQATAKGATTLNLGTLANTGALLTASDLAATVETLNNGGKLIADGKAMVNAGTATNTGVLQAGTDLVATLGAKLDNSGQVIAGGALTLQAASATKTYDVANAGGALLQSTGALSATGAGALANAGTLVSGSTLDVTAASFANSAGGKVQGTGATRLTTSGALTNQGQLIAGLDAGANGTISAGSLTNGGVLQSAGALSLTLADSLANSGKLLANGTLSISARDAAKVLTVTNAADAYIQGAGTVSVSGTGASRNVAVTAQKGYVIGDTVTLKVASLDNAGAVQSAKALTIDSEGRVANSGTIVGQAGLTLGADALTNSGTVQGSTGAALTVRSLDNKGSVIGALGTGGALTVSAETATNSGTMQSGGSTRLAVRDSLTNAGKLLAGEALTVSARDANARLTLSNTRDGTIQAGGTLTIGDAGNVRAGTFDGKVLANAAKVTLDGDLTSAAVVQTAGDLSLVVSGAVANSGTLYAKGGLAATAGSFANATGGQVQGSNASTLTATGAVTNDGTMTLGLGTGQSGTITAQSIRNGGTLQTATDLTLITRQGLDNAGTLYAGRNIVAKAGVAGDAIVIRNRAAGLLQADGALTIGETGSKASLVVEGGSVIADTLAFTGADLDNRGAIQADGNLGLTLSGKLDNSGTLLSQGTLSVTATDFTNAAAGQVEAVDGSTVTVTQLTNDGAFYVASAAGGKAQIRSDKLTNAGTMLGNGDVTLTVANTLTNSRDLTAAGNLTIQRAGAGTLSISNTASGTIQAGRTLAIKSSRDGLVQFTNQAGTVWGGTALDLAMGSLTNTGTLRSDGNATLAFTGAFTNQSGKVLLATSGSGSASLTASRVVNGNILQSQAGLDITVGAGGLTNTKTISATKDLTIAGIGGNYAIDGAGRYQSATGTLAIKGGNAAVTLGVNAILFGRKLDLDLRSLTLNGDSSGNPVGGALVAEGDLTLKTGTLAINAENAAIMGNVAASGATIGTGKTAITVGGALTNPGFVFSGAQLDVTAAGISNSAGGGINAIGNAKLKADGGNFENAGDIYVAGDLTVSAVARTITNRKAIRTEGSMGFTSNSFTNRSEISSKGNITVDAAVFENTIGQDPRIVAGALGRQNMPETSSNYYTLWEDDEAGDIPVPGRKGISNEGDTRYYHSGTYVVEDSFKASAGVIVRPRIVADGDLNIVNFQSATNFGGILSAHTLRLTGAGTTSTFVNDAVTLYKSTHTVSYQDFSDCDAAVGLNCDLYLKLGYTDAVTSQSEVGSVGASIYAVTLDVKAFKVNNIASVLAADGGSARNATGSATAATGATGSTASLSGVKALAGGTLAGGANGVAAVGGASGASLVSGVNLRDVTAVQLAVASSGIGGATTVSGQAAIAYQGVVITLPSGINGQFVTSREPTSSFLVETNPRFGLQGSAGSDFIARRLGINPDLLVRRLGDATYEAYLISQQIAAQVGTAKLVQAETSDEQVARLMTTGVSAAKALGLTYGKPLTTDQQANLAEDLVWMVETEVSGQKVLAPVVYLSAKSRGMFETGTATIKATETANFQVGSLTNTGGTIAGDKSLTVNATGDVRNTSGTMSGGNVTVKSTGGSIINETYASTTGGEGNKATIVGKKAGINATNGLILDAAKDITVSGATVSAGGDASIKAGNAVTFGTVDDVTSKSTRGDGSYNVTTTTKQLGSGLTVGGNLGLESGGDTTFKASDANVAGNADVKTGGDFNIIAGQNSVQTRDVTQTSGAGVGGGVYGTSKTTTDSFSGRNVSSNFNVGGNATVDAKGDMTVQGSNVNIGGNADVKAGSVNILQGKDVDTSTTTNVTTTYLGTSSDTKSSAGTSTDAKASAAGYSAQASAEAGAKAKNENSGNLELMNHTTTTTQKDSSRAVGSTFNVGGNANIAAEKDVTLQGSELNAGGNVAVDAKNINLLAAQNKDTTTTTTDSHSLGFMVDNTNSAEAKAGASASASFTAQAQAEAKATAESDTTVDLYRNKQSTTTATDITQTGSSIKSGGNTALTASNKLNVEGSSVDAGGDLDLKAKDMTFKEVNDVHEVTTTKQQTRIGLYANGNAEAKVGAEANMLGANAGASANAEAGAGVQVSHTSGSSTEGSTTAVTSSLKSGGNMTRSAENGITDVGTQIEAGGNFDQSAKTWDSKAAADTTYSSSSEQSDKARIGAYADAGAGATAGASVTGKGTGADADATAGMKASYEHEDSASTANSSTARTSSIKSGGSFTSTTTDKTALEGTQIQSIGDASLTAGSLDYTAARDTSSSTSDSNKGTAEVKAGISATKAVKAEASGSYEGSQAEAQSDRAVVGGITSGGNLNVKTTKRDANLEGTNLKAAGNGSIDSAGNVNFTAARDTASSSTDSQNASLGLSAGKSGGSKSGGVEVAGGFKHEDQASDTARVGSFVTGGDQSIKAAGDATLEGTKIGAGGKAGVSAGGDVTMKAAESTSSSNAYGAQLGLGVEGSKKDSPAKTPNAGAPGAGTGGNSAPARTGDAGTTPASSTPADAGSAGGTTGGTPKPVIGTRGQSGEGSTSSPGGNKPSTSSDGAGTPTPPAKPADGTPSTSTPAASKPAGKPDQAGSPATPTAPVTDAAGAPADTSGGQQGGWVSATPSALGAEAPEAEGEKPEGIDKGGSASGSFNYELTKKTEYTGSDVSTGGTFTVEASGNVGKENVKTDAQGGSSTTAGGKVTETTRKNTSDTKAGGASLGVKSNTANTSTGSADNAGDMTQ